MTGSYYMHRYASTQNKAGGCTESAEPRLSLTRTAKKRQESQGFYPLNNTTMKFYTSYSTEPQEKVQGIKERLANSQWSPLIFMRPQRNEHDMTDYMSLEIFWANGAEYELMDEYIEDYGDDYIVDSEGTTALERRSKLD